MSTSNTIIPTTEFWRATLPLPENLPASLRSDEDYPIVVHSHLRWDWVWQRPQQFLSRLSRRHPILFIEEPARLDDIEEPRCQVRQAKDHPGVTLLRTEFPPSYFQNREQLDAGQKMFVMEVLESPLGKLFANPVLWFYDPMAGVTFLGQHNERAVVYDCMDQLSQFRGAHPELIRRERILLQQADVVFAGGPKIYSAKKDFNPNCYSYGCGVDSAHFGSAITDETEIPEDARGLNSPVLGFFGVVDERMDMDLVGAVADAHPEWSLLIIGPVTKIDPESRPQRPNIHWLGGRDYAQLPGYCKAMDVCLLPFAINEATEFINPTKVLEYMATGRPIVSRAIEDVVNQFSDVVATAVTFEQFIEACEAAVEAPDAKRCAAGRDMARANTWERIVANMEQHIADVLPTSQAENCAA